MTNEEREALIARARETVHPTSDDTGERQTRALLSALDEARGQLAALHAAWANVLRREVKSLYGGGGYEQRSLWDLRDTFDDTAAAAKVYTDAVRAPVERERDAWRTDAEAIAAALGCEDGEWVSTELAAIVARMREQRDAAQVSASEWRERAIAADRGYGASFEDERNEWRARAEEYRAQVVALNRRVRALQGKPTVSLPVVQQPSAPALPLRHDFTCGECPFNDEDEHAEYESPVCGHPRADDASNGSPVLDVLPRPGWCPFVASDVTLEHAERLAAALVEVREAASAVAEVHSDGPFTRLRAALAALAAFPADLAAKRDARVRAKTLREAADDIRALAPWAHASTTAFELWLRKRADEAEKGGAR